MKKRLFIFLTLTSFGYFFGGFDSKTSVLSHGQLHHARFKGTFSTSLNELHELTLTPVHGALRMVTPDTAEFINVDAIHYRGMLIGGFVVGIVCAAIFLANRYLSTRPKSVTINELPQDVKSKLITEFTEMRHTLDTVVTNNEQIMAANKKLVQDLQQTQQLNNHLLTILTKNTLVSTQHGLGTPIQHGHHTLPTTTSSSSLYSGNLGTSKQN